MSDSPPVREELIFEADGDDTVVTSNVVLGVPGAASRHSRWARRPALAAAQASLGDMARALELFGGEDPRPGD